MTSDTILVDSDEDITKIFIFPTKHFRKLNKLESGHEKK